VYCKGGEVDGEGEMKEGVEGKAEGREVGETGEGVRGGAGRKLAMGVGGR